MIKRLNLVGNRLSAAVVHGGTVFTSGQVSLNDAGGTIEEQTKDVLDLIEKILIEAGTDKSKMLSASIWLTDIGDISVFNSIWDEWIPLGAAPARACVEAKLVSPDYIVEVAVIAALEE